MMDVHTWFTHILVYQTDVLWGKVISENAKHKHLARWVQIIALGV